MVNSNWKNKSRVKRQGGAWRPYRCCPRKRRTAWSDESFQREQRYPAYGCVMFATQQRVGTVQINLLAPELKLVIHSGSEGWTPMAIPCRYASVSIFVGAINPSEYEKFLSLTEEKDVEKINDRGISTPIRPQKMHSYWCYHHVRHGRV